MAEIRKKINQLISFNQLVYAFHIPHTGNVVFQEIRLSAENEKDFNKLLGTAFTCQIRLVAFSLLQLFFFQMFLATSSLQFYSTVKTSMLPFDLTKAALLIIILSYEATCLTISYRETSLKVQFQTLKMDLYGNALISSGGSLAIRQWGSGSDEPLSYADGLSPPTKIQNTEITQNGLHIFAQAQTSTEYLFFYTSRLDRDSSFPPLQLVHMINRPTATNYLSKLDISQNGKFLLIQLTTFSNPPEYKLMRVEIGEQQGMYSVVNDEVIYTDSKTIGNQHISENGRFVAFAIISSGIYVIDTTESQPTKKTILETTVNNIQMSACRNQDKYFLVTNVVEDVYVYDWNTQSMVYQKNQGFSITGVIHLSYNGDFFWTTTDTGANYKVFLFNKQNPNAWNIIASSDGLPVQDKAYIIGQTLYRKEIVIDQIPGSTIVSGEVQRRQVEQSQTPVQPVDCSLDPASTSSSISDSECQCLLHHSWDPKLSQCVANCKTQFSLSPKADNPLECECEEGAIWDQRQKQCVIDCPTVLYSTGQWVNKQICQCYSTSQWNPRTLTCEPDCKKQLLSTGILTDGACECVETARWNPNKGVCQIDCSLDENSLYDKPIPGEICICKEGFAWNGQICQVLDCSVIPYVDSTAQHPQGSCTCQSEFNWDSTLNQCKIDCSQVSGDLHQSTNAGVHSCLCQDGAFWEASALMCFVDCSSIDNALKNINFAECSCSEGYAWNQGQCLTTCGEKVGEQQVFNTDENRCQCLAGFSFYYNSPEGGACYRSCSSISYTDGQFGQSPGSCSCIQGFEWNQATNACEILCEGPYDSAVATQSTCSCIGSAVFINAINKCMPVCAADPLSTGSFNYDSFGCYCKVNAHWDKSTATCECNTNYQENSNLKKCQPVSGGTGAVLGIGGGVLSGVAVFIGMKIQRRKKDRESYEEKNVESQNKMKAQVEDI